MLGAGKASGSLALCLEGLLGAHLSGGLVCCAVACMSLCLDSDRANRGGPSSALGPSVEGARALVARAEELR